MTPSPLRLAFLGSPAFAVLTLEALIAAGHSVAAVYTQPPRPAGRGHRPQPSPVQAFAEARGLPVRTPQTLKTPAEQESFAELGLDAAVVVAYGLILPAQILATPRLGCYNVHASLLPRWRGAAPIQRAIEAGDLETGITIMRMDEGLDTGPMLLQERVAIGQAATAADLHEILAPIGARLMVEALAAVASGSVQPTPQPADGATYARKLSADEGRLDWSRPAIELARRVRAFNPSPGAWFQVSGERIKVLAAQAVEGIGESGWILDDRLTIACGRGALRLTLVQRQGRGPLPADAFLRGFVLPPGTRLP